VTDIDISYAIGLEPKQAVEYFSSKDAQVTGPWTEWLDAQHARSFTVANVTKLEVLKDIQDSLARALKQGKTLEQWKDDLVPMLKRKGWWGRDYSTDQLRDAGRLSADGEIAKGLTPARLRTIFQTNMQSAYMSGRYEQMVEQAAERPYWEYVAVLDSRTRPAHRALSGMVFRYDDPAWMAFYPPNGFNCRCRVRNFTMSELQTRGKTVSATDKSNFKAVDGTTKSGDSYTVMQYSSAAMPGGKFAPDPGFSNNPAQTAAVERLLDSKARNVLPPGAADDVLRQTLAAPVRQPAWQQFARDAQAALRPVGGEFAVGVADAMAADEARRGGAAVGDSALLVVPDVMIAGRKGRRHAVKGDALTPEDWAALPQALASRSAEYFLDAENRTLIITLPSASTRDGLSSVRTAWKSPRDGEPLTLVHAQRIAPVNTDRKRYKRLNKSEE
jgi:SPP1 gp7 family putative phage head morphogenesis protein